LKRRVNELGQTAGKIGEYEYKIELITK